jgi:U2-associated protein SR140
LLDALKQQTFSHGVRKKTKKEIEKENEEKKRIEEEK